MNLTSLSDLYTKSPATLIIALLVFIISAIGLLNKKFFFRFILHPVSVIKGREYFRIVISDFLNGDVIHLLLNEFMLYIFCSSLEERLRKGHINGSAQFLIIYFASLLIASMVVVYKHRNDASYSTVGTSGSIMGCMFAYMLLDPKRIMLYLPFLGGVKAMYAGLFYILILVIYQKRNPHESVNHEYHFYGALGGITATIILVPSVLHGLTF